MGHPVHLVENDIKKRNGDGTNVLFLPSLPVNVHSVSVDGQVLAPAGYQVDEDAGIILRVDGGVFPYGMGNVTVHYDHGWPEDDIPGGIQDAVLELASTLYMTFVHLQQNSAGSTQESYAAAATVGSTQAWVEAVAAYRAGIRS